MIRNEYNAKIARFSKALQKQLHADFPKNEALQIKVDNHLASIQFEILGELLKKGVIE